MFQGLYDRVGYETSYQRAVEAFKQFGIWFVIVAGFTPIPSKIVTIAAGALLMPLLGFAIGRLIGRGARFFLVAGRVWAGGDKLKDGLRPWVDATGWSVIVLILVAGLIYWMR